MKKYFVLLFIIILTISCNDEKENNDLDIILKEAYISNDIEIIEEAINHIDIKLKKNPEILSLYIQKTCLLIKIEKYNEAIDIINDILSKKSDFAEANTLKGIIFEKLDQSEKSKNSFKTAINIYENKIKNENNNKKVLSYKIQMYILLKLLKDKSARAYFDYIIDEYKDEKEDYIKTFIEILYYFSNIERNEIVDYILKNGDLIS